MHILVHMVHMVIVTTAPVGALGLQQTPLPPAKPAQQSLWELFVERFSATLHVEGFEGAHFICRTPTMCASEYLLQRINEGLVLPYTVFLSKMPRATTTLPPLNVFFLLGLDQVGCEVVRPLIHNVENLVVVISFLPRREFLSLMGNVFERCWKRAMLNVLAVHSRPNQTDGSLGVYTYYPYYPNNCHDMRPRLVKTWNLTSENSLSSFGLQNKMRNLNGCPLRVVTFFMRPWIIPVPNNKSSRFDIHGAYRSLIYEIERRMNFTAVFALPSDNQSYGAPERYPNFGGLLGDVWDNRSDLALIFTSGDVVTLYHERPPTAQVSCTTWCLPTGLNPYPLWRPLVDEFETPVWSGLLLAYITASMAFRVFIPASKLWNTAFLALRGLVGAAYPEPRGNPARAFLFCWSFFGMVMATLYMAALHSISTSDTTATVFRSLRELADSDLPIYMIQQHYDEFSRAQTSDEAEKRIMRRVHWFPLKQVHLWYGRLLAKRDIGLLIDRNACRFYSAMFTPPRHKPLYHHLRGYCMALGSCNNLILKKGSHLMARISRVTSLLDQGGLTSFWMTPSEKLDPGEHDPTLRIRNIESFLMFLVGGYVVAIGTFILELLGFGFYRCYTRFFPPAAGKAIVAACHVGLTDTAIKQQWAVHYSDQGCHDHGYTSGGRAGNAGAPDDLWPVHYNDIRWQDQSYATDYDLYYFLNRGQVGPPPVYRSPPHQGESNSEFDVQIRPRKNSRRRLH